jgi:hypothetical protein
MLQNFKFIKQGKRGRNRKEERERERERERSKFIMRIIKIQSTGSH